MSLLQLSYAYTFVCWLTGVNFDNVLDFLPDRRVRRTARSCSADARATRPRASCAALSPAYSSLSPLACLPLCPQAALLAGPTRQLAAVGGGAVGLTETGLKVAVQFTQEITVR